MPPISRGLYASAIILLIAVSVSMVAHLLSSFIVDDNSIDDLVVHFRAHNIVPRVQGHARRQRSLRQLEHFLVKWIRFTAEKRVGNTDESRFRVNGNGSSDR